MITDKELPQFVRDLLSSPPKRGGGLNIWFYRTARVLHPYRPPSEIMRLLAAATAGEPIKPGEIERAVERSRTAAWNPSRPLSANATQKWPAVNVEQREAILRNRVSIADLWETSPFKLEANHPRTEEFVDSLFPGNPLLCVGRSKTQFTTRQREFLRGQLSASQLIVPSPMTSRFGNTQDGKRSEHCLDNTGPRRFLVVEFDSGSPDEHAAILLHLATRAPLAIAVHSGGKSLHGWFYCAGQPDESLHKFMRYAVMLGADAATWSRVQFVRMPGGLRDNGERQTVYFFNPEVIK
jgi:hypothetical protein